MTKISPIAFKIGSVSVYWYGIIVAVALAVGYGVSRWVGTRFNVTGKAFDDFLLPIIPAAFIGARLWYVAFNSAYYSLHPAKILAFWEGGLAIHGGIIGGAIAAYTVAKIKKLNFLRYADIVAVGLPLGQAIGRWANYVNQEAYGGLTNLPWAMKIAGEYRHPTFLYESLWDLGLFFALYHFLKQRPISGRVLGLYLAGYSLGRFFIEGLRTDSLMIGKFRVAQIVSILLFGLGVFLYFFVSRGRTHYEE